ncbi:MAG TPA: extracellular solute-binding protein [Chloroflexota bacterium]|nr:extracellular solute-binding protein [Chloroflexota bacterium]
MTAKQVRRSVLASLARAVAGAGASSAAVGAVACASGTSQPDRPRTGGTDAATGAPPVPTLRRGVKLAFLTDSSAAGAPLVEQVLESWKQKQPDIAMEWLRPGGQVNLPAMVAAGTPPDVFAVNQDGFAPLANGGETIALEPYLARDRMELNDFFPAGLEMARWQGKQHGLPRAFNCGVVYTNLSSFDQLGIARQPEKWGAPGWGWAEFREVARRLSQDAADPREARFAADLLGGIGFFWAFVFSNGGEMFDATMRSVRLTEPPAVEALQFLADLIHRHKANPSPEVKQALGAREVFFNGQVAMQFIGASNVNLYQQISQFTWDWRPLPAGRAGARNWGGGFIWGASGKSALREEAWAVLRHLTSTESMVTLSTQFFPPRRSAAQAFLDTEAKANRPPHNRQMILDAMQAARVRPHHLRYGAVQQVFDEELGKLWSGEATAQQTTEVIKRRADPILQS